jgi:hypothetical protein
MDKPMPKTADQKLEELAKRFTADVIDVVRESALEAFASSFEGRLASPRAAPAAAEMPPVRRRRRRRAAVAPEKVSASVKAAAKRAKKASKTKRRVTGGKRDPKVLAALTEKLAQHVTSNAGQTMLEIGEALGASTSDLTLPARKLLDAKRIKRRGTRNLTKYFPA